MGEFQYVRKHLPDTDQREARRNKCCCELDGFGDQRTQSERSNVDTKYDDRKKTFESPECQIEQQRAGQCA